MDITGGSCVPLVLAELLGVVLIGVLDLTPCVLVIDVSGVEILGSIPCIVGVCEVEVAVSLAAGVSVVGVVESMKIWIVVSMVEASFRTDPFLVVIGICEVETTGLVTSVAVSVSGVVTVDSIEVSEVVSMLVVSAKPVAVSVDTEVKPTAAVCWFVVSVADIRNAM